MFEVIVTIPMEDTKGIIPCVSFWIGTTLVSVKSITLYEAHGIVLSAIRRYGETDYNETIDTHRHSFTDKMGGFMRHYFNMENTIIKPHALFGDYGGGIQYPHLS